MLEPGTRVGCVPGESWASLRSVVCRCVISKLGRGEEIIVGTWGRVEELGRDYEGEGDEEDMLCCFAACNTASCECGTRVPASFGSFALRLWCRGTVGEDHRGGE